MYTSLRGSHFALEYLHSLTKKLTKTHKMRLKYFLQTTTIIYYLNLPYFNLGML